MKRQREKKRLQGAGWRRLDNTGKLFAMVAGEELSNVFRVSAVLDTQIEPERLQRALMRTLPEFEVFRVRLRRGFFWYYFETNRREPEAEEESPWLCRFIDPHGNRMYLFRVSWFGMRINFEVFHALTDGMGAMNFLKRLVENYLEEGSAEEGEEKRPAKVSGKGRADRREGVGREAKETGKKERKEEAEKLCREELEEPGERRKRAGAQEGRLPGRGLKGPEKKGGGEGAQGQKTPDRESKKPEKPNSGKEKRETKTAGEISGEITGKTAIGVAAGSGEGEQNVRAADDGYLLHYRKRRHSGYEKKRAFQIREKRLSLGETAVFHGYAELDGLKRLCRREGVSMTKYLTALLLWSVIQVYLGGETGAEPVAVNLPINLRAFFESDTLANFFAVTNISFPEHRRPENFREVLAEVSRQMDEKIVRERLEETISYNVSKEKKWYVRLAPLALKNLVTKPVFSGNTKAYTLTLSNLGPVETAEQYRERIRNFHVMIGVSKKQPLKCGVAAFGNTVDITFTSVFRDRRLQDYFYGQLEEMGVLAGREENGALGSEFDLGNYPEMREQKKWLQKVMPWFYGALLLAAVITGAVNAATYRFVGQWWSVIPIAGIAYGAMTVRYSILRNSNLAGKMLRQSLGAFVLLVLIDWSCGYGGWSFNYAIPSILLFNVVAVGGLMAVNRLNWQSYFMYQIAITIFTLIPLLLWWAGLVTRPRFSLFTAAAACLLLSATAAVGKKSVKRELRKRFHL